MGELCESVSDSDSSADNTMVGDDVELWDGSQNRGISVDQIASEYDRQRQTVVLEKFGGGERDCRAPKPRCWSTFRSHRNAAGQAADVVPGSLECAPRQLAGSAQRTLQDGRRRL